MSTPPTGDLSVPLSIAERELLNEWAAEIDASVEELARRLVLRYLHAFPVRERDDLDDRIGRTLLARAGVTAEQLEEIRKSAGDAKRELGAGVRLPAGA